ncbi:unnamed protein product [Nezara viridula]|uniref:Pre-mRNA-processing factor 39 n=1 Tax=Nezara viridula TaxID=85310 RepID=A0A9P0HD92_NEZVI|nr:unnamed protein product [Nezara viridula]
MDNQEISADSMDIGESVPAEMVESSVEDIPEGVEDKLDNPVLNDCSMDLSELNDTAPKEVEITSEEVEIASEENDDEPAQSQNVRDKRETESSKKNHHFEEMSDEYTLDHTDEEKNKVAKTFEPESSCNDEEESAPNSIPTAHQPFTEVVSEDEFCVDGSESVLNTEAVSDDEFPLANTIENLETEDVSDEELPESGTKKRKDEDEIISHEGSSKKKAKLDKDKSPHKRSSEERDDTSDKGIPSTKHAHPSVKSKILPELEKYWKAVNDDPTDFTGWTYLLQYVDQESDVEAAREAYDAFLALYPYCYGYWRKYADYEKRKGDKDKCEEVFLRGLRAIPLSVDLWLHYLNFCKLSYKDQEDHIRGEFERAIEICGLEFRSDRLWDSYIKWETEGKHLQNVFAIYDQLLKIPTQGYKSHFEDFEDFVRSNPPSKILSVDEFLSLRSEVLMKLKQKPSKEVNVPPSAAPPGDDEGEHEEPSPAHADEETTLIRDKVISSQKKKYKDTVTAVLARWNFEEGIKRPYFHVKPLERCQLNTWREYLDFELAEGNRERIIILFERCLIACALYEEFWLKFLKYLEEQPDLIEKTRDVYERACCIHHPKKPFLSLSWATFEEGLGNFDKARQILARLEESVPNILHVNVRRINLERRCGNFEETANLYEKYLSNSKSKANFIVLSTKYARFCWKILNDPSKGIKVLRKAIDKDPENPRLYSQLLELTLMLQPFDEEQCISIFNEVIDKDSMDLEYKRIFAQRKLEFLEDFGSSVRTLQLAQVEYGNIMKQLKEKKKSSSKHDLDRLKQDDLSKSKGKSENSSSSVQNPQSPYSATNSNYNQSGSTYGVQSSYQSNSGQYSQPSSYGQQPFGQYNQTDQNYSGYQNWSYSQNTGYGNYNQNWGGYYSSY